MFLSVPLLKYIILKTRTKNYNRLIAIMFSILYHFLHSNFLQSGVLFLPSRDGVFFSMPWIWRTLWLALSEREWSRNASMSCHARAQEARFTVDALPTNTKRTSLDLLECERPRGRKPRCSKWGSLDQPLTNQFSDIWKRAAYLSHSWPTTDSWVSPARPKTTQLLTDLWEYKMFIFLSNGVLG